jgi:16S rRNA (guanine966-N2)-methyltransferase
MRIIAGTWRGRALASPGPQTRPTADRVRQALFDTLMHAPWAGRARLTGAHVLDAFAGTGALGLEALSRGAGRATFIERDPAALAALRRNIAGLRAVATLLEADALAPPRGTPAELVFLDPPYGAGLVPKALAALRTAGWLAPAALVVAETGRDEDSPCQDADALLDSRAHGGARISIWRLP